MASMAAKWLTSKLGGDFIPSDSLDMLSNGATELIEDALEGFETSEPIVDYNAWVVGIGTSGAGLYVHSSVNESVWKHPVANMKMKLLESACTIKDQKNWDAEYTARLLGLKTAIQKSHGAVWGRQVLHGLDQYHDHHGEPIPTNTALYIPNSYVYEVARDHPSHYVPCISIHPYKREAVHELTKWIKRGVKIVKWIPSVQGIDPSNERCDSFYTTMAQHGVILHSGGDRVLIDPPGFDLSLENPLLLRRALSFGVKVIVSHCASEGKSIDLEIPPHAVVDNLSLFLRMMEDPKYFGLLFGDISGICNFTRVECLLRLLDNTELHKRLVYGSDYPVPAINLVVQTYWFGNKGLVSERECDLIGEIYKTNPLLFDFVMKRTLKSKKGNKFNISIFKEHPDLKISKIDLVDDEMSAPPTPEITSALSASSTSSTSVQSLQAQRSVPAESLEAPTTTLTPSTLTTPATTKDLHHHHHHSDSAGSSTSSTIPLPLLRPPSPFSTTTPSPKFSITTPPSPAVRADPDRLGGRDSSADRHQTPSWLKDEGGGEGEDEEGLTEEVNLTD